MAVRIVWRITHTQKLVMSETIEAIVACPSSADLGRTRSRW